MSTRISEHEGVRELRRAEGIEGLVVNKIDSLGRDEVLILKKSYPGVNFKTCIILQEGREPAGAAEVWGFLLSSLAMIGTGLSLALLPKKGRKKAPAGSADADASRAGAAVERAHPSTLVRHVPPESKKSIPREPKPSPWFDYEEGLPHPRWKTVYQGFSKERAPEKHAEGLAGFCGQWVKEFAAALGPPYAEWASANFLLLSPQDPHTARITLEGCENSLRRARTLLGETAAPASPSPLTLLLFADETTYYRYTYPPGTGGRRGGSSGCFISSGPGHVASVARENDELASVLAHEISHFLVHGRSWPLWLGQGVVQYLEEALTGLRRRPLDRPRAEQHRRFWRRAGLRSFWSGSGFHHAGLVQSLSYELAQIVTHNLSEAGAAFVGFLRKAHYADCGRSAAEAAFVDSLGVAAGIFLGKGDWEPRPEDGRDITPFATLLTREGRYPEAIVECDAALAVDPQRTSSWNARAYARMKLGQFDAAVADLEGALRLDPDNRTANNNLAWILATAPEDRIRDGRRALEHALRACAAEKKPTWNLLGTLASAFAEAGDFTRAQEVARRSLELVPKEERESARRRLSEYEAGRPCRDGGVDPEIVGNSNEA